MVTITGRENIELARYMALKGMLRLEMKGLKRHGRSAYSIVKSELGFRGNREKVLKQLEEYIDDRIVSR